MRKRLGVIRDGIGTGLFVGEVVGSDCFSSEEWEVISDPLAGHLGPGFGDEFGS